MSKFLTPPVWYDGYGTLNDMLTGKSVEAEGGNVVIGSSAEAGANVFNSVIIFGSATGTQSAPTSNAIIAGVGASASGAGVIAIGAGSSATAEGAIASGLSAKAKNTGAIAIGRNAEAEASGAIAIGDGASAPSQNTIQLGKNSATYTLNVGNGYVSIGKFSISPITSGKYANQVILGNVNQIKAPTAGISFEVAARRDAGTIIYPSKIQTLIVDAPTINATTYNVKKHSVTSTDGSATLSANCLYLIKYGSTRAMLHTIIDSVDTYQYIYAFSSTIDTVMCVKSATADATSVICKIQRRNKDNNTYSDYTETEFTAIKVCSFT